MCFLLLLPPFLCLVVRLVVRRGKADVLAQLFSKILVSTPRYSTNQDISRACQGFFTAKVPFLLILEPFHFYQRYNPQHPQCAVLPPQTTRSSSLSSFHTHLWAMGWME
ncbi:hypothetical protein BV22DRAFT_823611 [Leucogyrophana mollusca]|uniref:Uncharacterized protein n=1 Tax=Leucogyrophana mollusca TaxID=85980 RepID=A0ACB8B5H8_9AGAM|nr:hypothetical protein BV22DRAFT_823611 [Leucogyrophana mollusca]